MSISEKNIQLQIETIDEKCKRIQPKVVIHCLTFNHERFLKDTLEGFLMQKTTFPFVAIVHEDASTDNTAEVLREYAEKYPDIILPIYEAENQYSKRDGSLEKIMNNACKKTGAKYIAICEGDDYWTDSLKLQNQVDFLEQNLEYSFTCHRFSIYDEKSQQWYYDYGYKLFKEGHNLDINIDLFLKIWVTQPLTAVIRKSLWDEYNNFSKKFNYSRDVHLFYFLLTKGKGIALNKNMGVYRWHDGGIARGSNRNDRIKTSYSIFKELFFATHDKKILNLYLNFIIQLYSIQKTNRIKKELYNEAITISSRRTFIKKLIKRKLIIFLRQIGLLSQGTSQPPKLS